MIKSCLQSPEGLLFPGGADLVRANEDSWRFVSEHETKFVIFSNFDSDKLKSVV